METNYKVIIYNNNKEKVLQFVTESNTQFEKRKEYIKTAETKKYNFKEAIRLSKIWYCIMYRHAQYDKEIYTLVMNVTK